MGGQASAKPLLKFVREEGSLPPWEDQGGAGRKANSTADRMDRGQAARGAARIRALRRALGSLRTQERGF